MKFQLELAILLLLPIATLQISEPTSSSYIAAVAEYKPVIYTTSDEKVADINAQNYIKFIKKAVEYSADIIVFPESSLSIASPKDKKVHRSQAASYVPEPTDNIVPCDNGTYAKSLQLISCAARDHKIYVVVNHKEKADCQNGTIGCADDNLLIYNTNVAFDRQGRVIARYRKFNLFGEHNVNKTPEAMVSTFESDFGVTFGQFICFDLLFAQPGLNLTRQMGIGDVIFSSHWFSELPFLFSVEAQAGWSYVNDVNLLSSGYNDPATGSGGSGIFIGRNGYSHVVMRDKPSNVLVVAEVPKIVKGERRQGISGEKTRVYEFGRSEIETSEDSSAPFVHLTDDLSIYTTVEVDLKKSSHEELVCDRGFCCDFKLKISFDASAVTDNTSYYRYRLAAFNGTRSFSGVATGGIQTCGVISCANGTLSSCGKILESKTVLVPTGFQSIEITTRNVGGGENVLFMPVGLSRNFEPLNATDYTFETIGAGASSKRRATLARARDDLLTFAIFGRNFANDGLEVTANASVGSSLNLPYFLIALSLVKNAKVF